LGRRRSAAPRGSSYAHRGVRGYITRDATQIINIISLHTHTGSTSKSNLHSVCRCDSCHASGGEPRIHARAFCHTAKPACIEAAQSRPLQRKQELRSCALAQPSPLHQHVMLTVQSSPMSRAAGSWSVIRRIPRWPRQTWRQCCIHVLRSSLQLRHVV
jgi:hypothetical protein